MENDKIIRIVRTSENAVIPTKAHDSDSGFDVTILEVAKEYTPFVKLYETGIKISPREGYYTELVGRSSLMKFGYMLANNIGIIDNSYTDTIKVALYKFDPSLPDLELPMRVAQLIPRKIVNVTFVEVDKLNDTKRGEGGFGSTGTN
jgi:dUTP pyrophosphatase